MNVLVTAGGTTEAIDRVRCLTNLATGRLGSLIADAFSALPGCRVTYLCTHGACRPARPVDRTVEVGGVLELEQALTGLLGETAYDAVVHSMAVSDYLPGASASVEELAAAVADRLLEAGPIGGRDQLAGLVARALLEAGAPTGAGKLSSDTEHLALLLRRAPKVIAHIKRLQPHTLLVGFKLLAGVEQGHLLDVARGLMDRNHCDLVLANDLDGIAGDRHRAWLVDRQGTVAALETKEEIAAAIAARVGEQVGG